MLPIELPLLVRDKGKGMRRKNFFESKINYFKFKVRKVVTTYIKGRMFLPALSDRLQILFTVKIV